MSSSVGGASSPVAPANEHWHSSRAADWNTVPHLAPKMTLLLASQTSGKNIPFSRCHCPASFCHKIYGFTDGVIHSLKLWRTMSLSSCNLGCLTSFFRSRLDIWTSHDISQSGPSVFCAASSGHHIWSMGPDATTLFSCPILHRWDEPWPRKY